MNASTHHARSDCFMNKARVYKLEILLQSNHTQSKMWLQIRR